MPPSIQAPGNVGIAVPGSTGNKLPEDPLAGSSYVSAGVTTISVGHAGVSGFGESDTGFAVYATSKTNDAVHGETSSGHAGVSGTNTAEGPGLWGQSKIARRLAANCTTIHVG